MVFSNQKIKIVSYLIERSTIFCYKWLNVDVTKKIKIATLVLVALLIVTSLVWFNRARVFVFHRTVTSLKNIEKDIGYSYVAELTDSRLASEAGRFKVRVLENKLDLNSPQDASIEYIQGIGAGSYKIEKSKIYFSAPDNSSPLLNGRVYEVSSPLIVRYYIAYPLYGLTSIIAIFLLCILVVNYYQLMYNSTRCYLSQLDQYRTKLILPNRFTITSILVVCFTIFLIVSCLLFLNSQEVVVIKKNTAPIINIVNGTGYQYYSDMKNVDNTWNTKSKSLAVVYENGIRLSGPANVDFQSIAKQGAGIYCYLDGIIVFSSSDNTSPLCNGRNYTLEYSVPVNPTIVIIFYWLTILLLILCILCLVICYSGDELILLLRRAASYQLGVGILILVVAHMVPRLGWCIDYQYPLLMMDSHTYLSPIQDYYNGKLPLFDIRSPGYPLFMFMVFSIYKSVKVLVIVQVTLSLLSATLFIVTINKILPSLTTVAVITMVAQVTEPTMVESDFVLITESLYGSVIVLSVTFMILSIKSKVNKALWLFITSILFGAAILVKPNSIYLIPVYVLLFIYIYKNRYLSKSLVAFVLPLPMIVLLFMFYNYYTLGKFTMSYLGTKTVFSITSYYWQPTEEIPKEINDNVIIRLKSSITEGDYNIIQNTWDYDEYLRTIIPYINLAFYGDGDFIPEQIMKKYSGSGFTDKAKIYSQMSKIAKTAILSNPRQYFRFTAFNLIKYFSDTHSWKVSLYRDMNWLLQFMYVDHWVQRREFSTLFPQDAPSSLYIKKDNNHKKVIINDTRYTILQDLFTGMLSKLYNKKQWTFLYFVALIFSFYRLVRTSWADPLIFLLATISATLFFCAVTYSFMTPISSRYTSPLRFIEIFSALVFLHIIIKDTRIYLQNYQKFTFND